MISPPLPFAFLAIASLLISIPLHADEYTGHPFGGKPQIIPGTITLINYDGAPDNKPDVSFHYDGTPNKSPFRPSEDAIGVGAFDKSHMTTDGKPCPIEGGYLGWTQSGEWAKYTVTVTQSGTYQVGGKFASAGTTSQISVTFSPTQSTGPLSIPTTAGFQPQAEVYHVWEIIPNLKEIDLRAGTYVMKVMLDKSDGLNASELTFTLKK